MNIHFTEPLLAATATIEQIEVLLKTKMMYVSPKLDGIRCITMDGKFVSRKFKPLPNKWLQSQFGNMPEGLDGELVLYNGNRMMSFSDTSSFVMAIDKTPDVNISITYAVFDLVDAITIDQPFVHRMAVGIPNAIKNIKSKIKVTIVNQCLINTTDALLRLKKKYMEQGYEGVMLRDCNALYKFGRSTAKQGILVKYKDFHDDEAVITGFEPLYVNNNIAEKDNTGHTKRSTKQENLEATNMLGKLIVDYKGIELGIGSGFTDEERYKLWDKRKSLIGKLVKFKYQKEGAVDAPRFPVYLGIRDKIDT